MFTIDVCVHGHTRSGKNALRRAGYGLVSVTNAPGGNSLCAASTRVSGALRECTPRPSRSSPTYVGDRITDPTTAMVTSDASAVFMVADELATTRPSAQSAAKHPVRIVID